MQNSINKLVKVVNKSTQSGSRKYNVNIEFTLDATPSEVDKVEQVLSGRGWQCTRQDSATILVKQDLPIRQQTRLQGIEENLAAEIVAVLND